MKWLFLVHQIQTPDSRERVKVWRLTKKIGAQLYRNSVYVLPYSRERLEDFQWLCQQIRDSKGEASVFVTDSSSEGEDKILVSLFQQARESEYKELLKSLDSVVDRITRMRNVAVSPVFLKDTARQLQGLSSELSDIQRIDYFSHPIGRKAREEHMRAQEALAALEVPAQGSRFPEPRSKKAYQRKVWATRENIHIDRVCSSWLIRRFIDPKARFVFAPESRLPRKAIPFDVLGAEFGHHDDLCTFETLLKVFGLKDPALQQLAQLVHDIDLKDHKFGRGEAAGIDLVIRSVSDTLKNDAKVLNVCFPILDGLYARFRAGKRLTSS